MRYWPVASSWSGSPGQPWPCRPPGAEQWKLPPVLQKRWASLHWHGPALQSWLPHIGCWLLQQPFEPENSSTERSFTLKFQNFKMNLLKRHLQLKWAPETTVHHPLHWHGWHRPGNKEKLSQNHIGFIFRTITFNSAEAFVDIRKNIKCTKMNWEVLQCVFFGEE